MIKSNNNFIFKSKATINYENKLFNRIKVDSIDELILDEYNNTMFYLLKNNDLDEALLIAELKDADLEKSIIEYDNLQEFLNNLQHVS